MKWAKEMGQLDIGYKLQKIIMGQVLANFIVELNSEYQNEIEKEGLSAKRNKRKIEGLIGMEKEIITQENKWEMF